MARLLNPRIRWRKALFSFLLWFLIIVLETSIIYYVVLFLYDVQLSLELVLLAFFCFTILTITILSKRIIIFFILLYQRSSPDHVRMLCRYTPSCSIYMIMAINKYGVIKGVYKGVKRLLRCKPPNGGIDFP